MGRGRRSLPPRSASSPPLEGRLRGRQKEEEARPGGFQTSVRLLHPGDLAEHAVSEGTKAVIKFTSS
ncbi:hypothetical protein GW17_00012689 [Ensete ventricosum]|nr:hypothetical protein GW17_00012689 [Ensete ventricosum]